MEYRVNQKTGDRISVIGLGTSYISESSEREAAEALLYAHDHGFNYADLATAGGTTFSYYGSALSSVRKEMFYQVHFGANYETGKYGWTTDLDTVKRQIDWQLSQLKTDYIDYGFVHCLDEKSDWEAYQKNGVLQFLLDKKQEGVVRHIGLSTHTPSLAQQVLDMGLTDQLMFSINPAYDYHHGTYAKGSADERMALYRRCEAEGVGISVMKPFSGGQLLDEKTSPFGKALTRYQCIQYALDKPGVLTVVPGIRNVEDVKELLGFFDAPDEERDYSVLGSFAPQDAAGTCVYCNHCQPCPAGLDIGLMNKYYDLSKAGDAMAAKHYENLDIHADACIKCGHCESRCPFHVKQMTRMEEIRSYFGDSCG
ncbi:MAG: 4Fe-4S binding protein [Hungatella sp.]|jgi:predicted aldo/keto reductase-like oxidoreductase|nr:4Fe-4S binding protein [Lachnospiraceae bacterium]MCI9636972.1 4Fe-4S binding protein [Hungatella sp.]